MDRSKYARWPYFKCAKQCSANTNLDSKLKEINPPLKLSREYLGYHDKWFAKHGDDSYIEFWSAGLICFILGMYQLGASIVVYNQLSDIKES